MNKVFLLSTMLSVASLSQAGAADMGQRPTLYPHSHTSHFTPLKQYNNVYVASHGWYLRGDVGFAGHDLRGAEYATTTGMADFTTVKLKESFSLGGGVGYQITDHVRTDLTLDYMFKSSFEGTTGPGGPCNINGSTVVAPNCVSEDSSSWRAWNLMANAYVDIFTHGRVTAYAGAGLGAAYVKWDTLNNTECNSSNGECNSTSIDHEGAHGWRAAGALIAGATVHLNCAWKADVNYRYKYIAGGRMFEYNATGTTGPGFSKAIHSHEARAGLRYSFGACHPQTVYHPPKQPPIYK